MSQTKLRVIDKSENMNKNQALESAVSIIEKNHGKGSIMKLGSKQKIDIETVPAVKVSHKRRKFSAGKSLIPTGGKGNYEVLIMFENNSDSPLKNVTLPDFVPKGFELKGHNVSGATKENSVELNTSESDEGINLEWVIPIIHSGQKFELSYDIKGDGDLKISDLQSFRGAKIGDDDDDEMIVEKPDVAEDASKEDSDKEPTLDDYSWNEDVLLSAMEEYGITDRELFLAHAINFDEDGNLYLKKSEIVNAAKNFNLTDNKEVAEETTEETAEEVVEETAEEVVEETAEEVVEEANNEGDDFESKLAGITYNASEEQATTANDDDSSDGNTSECPMCGASVEVGASKCSVCGFTFN